MRAVIYARFSTELQRDASIEDQERVCLRLITKKGWHAVETYADLGMSGASDMRPAYQRMMSDARSGQFDVVVAESLDRLSRDQEHMAAFHKRMTYLGIPIVTVTEGQVTELHIGLKGTMSALYLKDLAQKTHRGLEGRIRNGKAAGGISYGYRVLRQLTESGEVTTGEREIDEAKAKVVRRIFETYAAGQSPRRIAAQLNAEGVTGPTGSSWSMSSIYGNWRRGTGVLNNELYVGRLVWNRQRFVKDPESGRRQARPNDPREVVTEQVPHLRIISDDLWNAVKRRQHAVREDMGIPEGRHQIVRARRPRYLFSGLISCGSCGSNFVLISKTRYGCAAARNKGTCTMRMTIEREMLERRVLGGLREHLMQPDLIATFAAEYQAEFNRLRREEAIERSGFERELTQVQRKIDQIVEAICDGLYNPSMKEKLTALEDRKLFLRQKLDEAQSQPVLIHPSMAEHYRRRIGALVDALTEDGQGSVADALRRLIVEIRVQPDGPDLALELVGELGAILALSEAKDDKTPAFGEGLVRSTKLVAGAGFEPAAFRL